MAETRVPLPDGLPYVVPFALLMLLLVAGPFLPAQVDAPLRVVVLSVALYFSRRVIRIKSYFLIPTTLLGIAVFLAWIAPDSLFPRYREHWLLQNPVTGTLHVSIPRELLSNPWILACRVIRAVVLVPIIEELFWRGWLMRWLISHDFDRVPFGAYSVLSFSVTAILFATEHGPYWDVGLMAGIAYNWWAVRTRSLGDCILAHAVTNAGLAGYVIAGRHWEYWL